MATPVPTAPRATILQLRLTDDEGKSVPFAKAQLFLEAWSQAETITLTVESDLLEVSLDKSSMPPPEYDANVDNWESCRLYVEAEGYAPVQSKPMVCIGMGSLQEPSDLVTVEFPSTSPVNIARGETKQIELTLRKPKDRFVCFVNDLGLPVPGVRVVSEAFWTASNHCGWILGDWLDEGISDQKGCLAIPDGDFEYALLMEKDRYNLREDNPGRKSFPMALITYLSDSTTVIRLHQWEKRRLEIVASVNKEPLVGQTLWGDWSLAPCGLIEEDLGTTDANGRIVVEEFYPDEWWEVYFRPEGAAMPSWRADPRQLSGIVQVDLESWPTRYKRPVDVWGTLELVLTDTWQMLLPD